ncbi:uncharacterized protein UTRI_01408_B [Ustilago trichophora]|uniref:Matrin-type domain-containing protein n=1 Tax=Ustilago trichophora TaxID=86804 RepID=A0A5C3E2F8_9BASI|nr:uncharacterized protein UTRI_01408_B [Ustilago trichophora]
MADVWISRKRWTCKYCDVTINDDLPSKRHHESGLRHKRNVEKALQDLYRKGEQERKDAEQTRKEMARIEALAAESYAKDQGLGHQSALTPTIPSSSPATSAVSSASAQPRPVPGPSRQPTKSIDEPNREATQPVAQAGEWESVEPAQPLQHASSTSTFLASETSDRDKARSFRMKEKVARFDDSDDEDGLSTIKVRKRPRTDDSDGQDPSRLPGLKKEALAHIAGSMKNEPDDPTTSGSGRRTENDTNASASPNLVVKKEEEDESKTPSAVKEEGDGGKGAGGGLFKKRRAGAGAGAKRVRAII